jgi:hypothetical protein
MVQIFLLVISNFFYFSFLMFQTSRAMASIAAVGWSISIASWIMSPIVTKILNEGFEFLGFDESEKLQDLESRVLPRLALMLESVECFPISIYSSLSPQLKMSATIQI